MPVRWEQLWNRLNLAKQYMLASLVVLLASLLVMSWWVASQIEAGVIQRSAVTTALFVESFIGPQLREIGEQDEITPSQADALNQLLRDTSMGRQVVAFKVWNREGRILFNTNPALIGQVFPLHGDDLRAWQGELVAGISDLRGEENAEEREKWSRLLEFYVPVRQQNTNQVVAVAQFYQTLEGLESEVSAAQTRSLAVVGFVTLITYLLLAGIVRKGSDTIAHQQDELQRKIDILLEVLKENRLLNDRVQSAAQRVTELNERFLRRIGSELHDGPAQDLSLALLRLDAALEQAVHLGPSHGDPDSRPAVELDTIQFCLRRALQDIRAISAGLRLPEIEKLTLARSIARAVRAHERRTSSRVEITFEGIPHEISLPAKMTFYRVIQEALSNAYRHGRGQDQQVLAYCRNGSVTVEISDRGPGMDLEQIHVDGQHMGLASMRERVEILGGEFQLESSPGRGTRVRATLPMQVTGGGQVWLPSGQRSA